MLSNSIDIVGFPSFQVLQNLTGQRSCLVLTLFDRVITVAVGVVGHVSEQGVVGMRVFGAQAVCICSCICASPPCESAWKTMKRRCQITTQTH